MQMMGVIYLCTIIPLILWMPIQGVRRGEIRLLWRIGRDRHPIWFWINIVFLTLCGVVALLMALAAIIENPPLFPQLPR
jgi:hypothetical protein